ncbi:MAG: hypothetical protein E5V51_18345, partial [Mesorhizobium sp.]
MSIAEPCFLVLHVLACFARLCKKSTCLAAGQGSRPFFIESTAMSFSLNLAPQHRVYAGFAT